MRPFTNKTSEHARGRFEGNARFRVRSAEVKGIPMEAKRLVEERSPSKDRTLKDRQTLASADMTVKDVEPISDLTDLNFAVAAGPRPQSSLSSHVQISGQELIPELMIDLRDGTLTLSAYVEARPAMQLAVWLRGVADRIILLDYEEGQGLVGKTADFGTKPPTSIQLVVLRSA